MIMQHDGTLEPPPLRRPLYIHVKLPREKTLKKNHKYGSWPKDFNKNKYTSKKSGPPQATITRPLSKAKPVRFEDPYDHIHHMENHNENTHLIDTQEQDMENSDVEQD